MGNISESRVYTKGLYPQVIEVGLEERLQQSGCCRAKDQFGETIVEDRKDNEKPPT